MNILFFTSQYKSAINTYNIGELLRNRPDHSYSFVIVNRKPQKVNWWDRFKIFVVRIRDGKNTWLSDMRILEKEILDICRPVSWDDYPCYFVHDVNGLETQKTIQDLEPDIIIQAGAGILKENIFSIAKNATINVHHGYAPEVRGMKSTYWCLYYGLTDLIGVTCHKIDRTLDTGHVIRQHKHHYQDGESLNEIEKQLCQKGAQLLIESIDLLEKDQFEVESKEVCSYYFSNVNHLQYNRLKANNFAKVEEGNKLKTKIKIKTKLIV